MARHGLPIERSAAKEIEAVARAADRQGLARGTSALAVARRPTGCAKLGGDSDRYRVRRGPYRVAYSVDDTTRIVEVVRVGHRRDVYRP